MALSATNKLVSIATAIQNCTIYIRVWYIPYAYGIKYAYGTEHSDKQQEQTGSYTKKASLSIANKNNFTSATAVIERLPLLKH